MSKQQARNENFDRFYSERFSSDHNAVKVGWKSKQAQYNRFSQITKLINSDSFTINDLGCGLGDFYTYLRSKDFKDFVYYGYDIIPVMIEEAVKLHSVPNAKFTLIQEPEEMIVADYTIASGIFNLKFNMSDAEWLRYVYKTISVMFAKSVKGVAFNCLTSYSDKEYMKDDLYYANPGEVFDFCKRNLSRNVALLHDYDEYDFTILIRKQI